MNALRLQLGSVALASACIASPWPVPQRLVGVPFEPTPLESARPEMSKGVKNIALGKRVTSSDSELIFGSLTQVTDGVATKEWRTKDLGEIWSDDGAHIELNRGKQWVQIDLGSAYEIECVGLWYRHPVEGFDVPFDVVVQLSLDEDFGDGAETIFNCDSDDSLGLGAGKQMHFATSRFGKYIAFEKTKARYVRVLG